MSLISIVKDDFGLRLELGGDLLEQEENNARRADGKVERSESVLRSRGKRWCCKWDKSSGCSVNTKVI